MAVVEFGIASRQLTADRAVVIRVHVKEMRRREGSIINLETESC
jgi:ribosomal protein L14